MGLKYCKHRHPHTPSSGASSYSPQDRLNRGFGCRGRQSVVVIISGSRTIHIADRIGIVNIEWDGSAVAQEEGKQTLSIDIQILLAINTPHPLCGATIRYAIPQIFAQIGRPAAHNIGPRYPGIRRILQTHGVVGCRAPSAHCNCTSPCTLPPSFSDSTVTHH